MGNIVTTLKRFLANKNTVTILGVLLGLVVLFIGYNYRVSTAVEMVTVPYAKRAITATQPITTDAVGTTEILKSTLDNSKNMVSQIGDVLNSVSPYCVATFTSVPQGAFFYKEQVKVCSDMPNDAFRNMPDNYKPAYITVDMLSTYGNSMFPGDYIDIYARMEINGLLMYAPFITKLQILDVRDSNGRSVFSASNSNSTPALLLFAVPEDDMYLLLSKATLLTDKVVELIPVPGNASYTSEKGETRVTSEFIRDQIESKTFDDPSAEVDNTTE